MSTSEHPPDPELVKQQAGKVVGLAAGYVGFRTVELGLRHGLLEELARHPEGVSPDALADATGLDPFYVGVWCRSAFGAEVLDGDDEGTYRLAPLMATILLDESAPGYAAGLFVVLGQPEVFDRFSSNLTSGRGIWWNDCGPEFIRGAGMSGRAFYTRLVPGGLERVPGLSDRLAAGARIMDLACGTGTGLIRLAGVYPEATLVGVDGDEYSIELARKNVEQAGFVDRVEFVQSTLEDVGHLDEFDAIIINISMHECRDLEKVTANVHRALKPDGHFVISDFPFPATIEDLRTPAARLMSGIQFFEALIGDQLLPTAEFERLLAARGFRSVDSFDITPVHAVTFGQK